LVIEYGIERGRGGQHQADPRAFVKEMYQAIKQAFTRHTATP
jgi:hypothetical protein